MTNLAKSIQNYLIASFRELKKVTWPSKKQTINYTVTVIAMGLGIMIFFAILDYVFDIVLKTLI